MKALYISFLLFLSAAVSFQANAQPDEKTGEPNQLRKRYLLFSTPVSKDTRITGVALGLMAVPWKDAKRLEITGVNLELEPWAALIAPMGLVVPVLALFKKVPIYSAGTLAVTDSVQAPGYYHGTTIKGVSVSGGGLTSDTRLYGLGINGCLGMADSYGVQISGIMNGSDEFAGLQVSAIGNATSQGKGVQIGLFNTCLTGQVLQIGLLNRIGNRVIPVVNFRLRTD